MARSKKIEVQSTPSSSIEDISSSSYAKKAYEIYGKYCIEERAVADYRDGLKPVQRRILWAMHSLGLNYKAQYKKSAKIVGETMGCFTGDTKVRLLDGEDITFEDLYKKYKDSDEVFNVYSVKQNKEYTVGTAHHPRITKYVDELIQLTLDNDDVIQCTLNHPFLVKNPKENDSRISYMEGLPYIKAIDLNENDLLTSFNFYSDKKVVLKQILKLENKIPVYDLTVDTYHNFALKSGVFAHNSLHPHGDAGIYGGLVTMNWLRYPLIKGQGNFGCLTSGPAASRYTEAKLQEISNKFFDCIDVATMVPNYSGDLKEPLVLPSRLPNILINGSEGIAVGLSANLPPHNLKETVEGLKFLLNKPNASVEEVYKYIKGPDYNTGICISEPQDIINLYKNGWGTLRFRCDYKLEKQKDHNQLIITNPAPRFNIFSFIKSCQKLVDDDLLFYVVDETSKSGFKISVGYSDFNVIKYKVIPLLYTSISYQFYVTDRTEDREQNNLPAPKFMNLLDLMNNWLNYRKDIESQLINLDIKNLEEKLWKQEALLKAVVNIGVVKKSMDEDKDKVNKYLCDNLKIDEKAANYILDTPIRSIMKFNEEDQKAKVNETKNSIQEDKNLLSNISSVVSKELDNLLKFSDERGTLLEKDKDLESFSVEPSYVLGSRKGYITKTGNLDNKLKYEDFILKAVNKVTIIDSIGMATNFNITCLKDMNTEIKDIVNIIPDTKSKLIVMDTYGYGLAINHPIDYSEYQTIKTDNKIKIAIGINEKDKVLVWNDKMYYVYDYNDFTVKRANTFGKLLLPYQKQNVEMIAIPNGAKLIDSDGFEISFNNFINHKDDYYLVGNKNYVIYKNGYKCIMKQAETIIDIGKGNIKDVMMIE